MKSFYMKTQTSFLSALLSESLNKQLIAVSLLTCTFLLMVSITFGQSSENCMFYWSTAPEVKADNNKVATGEINGVKYTYTSSQPISFTDNIYNYQGFPASQKIPNQKCIKNSKATTNVIEFAEPVRDPVLVFASIGSSRGTAVPIEFNKDINVLWKNDQVTVVNNRQIKGTEGYAVVQIKGTHSRIEFNYTVAENYVNFLFGVSICQECEFYWSTAPEVKGDNNKVATGEINGVQYTYTSSQPITFTDNIYNYQGFPTSQKIPNQKCIKNSKATTNVIEFAEPVRDPVLVFASIGSSRGTAVPIEFNKDINVLWKNDQVTVVNSRQIKGIEGYAVVQIKGIHSSIEFDYTVAENYVNFLFGVSICQDCEFYWSTAPEVKADNNKVLTGEINRVKYTYTSSQSIAFTQNIYNYQAFPASQNIPNQRCIKNSQATTNVIEFAEPVRDPVLVFASIGSSKGTAVPIEFNKDINVLWKNDQVTVVNNREIKGTEGYAVVQIMGTHSRIEFNYTVAENYVNFLFGSSICASSISSTSESKAKIEVIPAGNFNLQWNDQSSRGIRDGSFYRPVVPNGYYSVGDFAQNGYTAPPSSSVMLVKPLEEGVLAPPVDFELIWKDTGSGAKMDGSFWRPIAPEGYRAIGIVCQPNYNKPTPDVVRCVREDLLTPGQVETMIWNTKGTNANTDFSTWSITGTDSNAIECGTFLGVTTYDQPDSNNPLLFCLNPKITIVKD
jgi:hypothetical protein